MDYKKSFEKFANKLAIVGTSIMIMSIITIITVGAWQRNIGYRNGQIDALKGKFKYHSILLPSGIDSVYIRIDE
jgi:hypothetical protein